jgi:sulfate/thiosulfate transport system permease protein
MRRRSVIPGFGLSLGVTVLWLTVIVLFPLAGLAFKTGAMTWAEFTAAVLHPRLLASYRVTFGAALAAAIFNGFVGLAIAWVLVRAEFPGRRFADMLLDLPFALPTAVAGIALTAIYAPDGLIGCWAHAIGIETAYSPIGIVIAMSFVGLPFSVRTVQPVLEDLGPELEEAARCLGATRWQIFRHVLLPAILPAILTGFGLAFGRAIGEYGSVIFIAGNMPMRTEITPVLVVSKLEQYDYAGATAIALVLLAGSFGALFAVNVVQRISARWAAGEETSA